MTHRLDQVVYECLNFRRFNFAWVNFAGTNAQLRVTDCGYWQNCHAVSVIRERLRLLCADSR